MILFWNKLVFTYFQLSTKKNKSKISRKLLQLHWLVITYEETQKSLIIIT